LAGGGEPGTPPLVDFKGKRDDQGVPVAFPKLKCIQCHSEVSAACDCGAPYLSPFDLAAQAVKADPEKSNRAIAAEIGVSNQTVMRARKAATAPNGAVEKRRGRDVKRRRQPSGRQWIVGSLPENQDDAADDTDASELWSDLEGSIDRLLQAGISGAEITMRAMFRVGVTIKTEKDLKTSLRKMATHIRKHAA
jgi:hypothetical protein